MKLRPILAVIAIIPASAQEAGWRPLLDDSLSNWEIFMGVPHKTVEIPGVERSTSENCTSGTPLGLNNDPLKVFTTEQQDGQTVLHISGQIYGGLTSKEEFENYHLSLEVKWGEKKWEPRLNVRRDSGLLIHCTGNHGTFWKVWMSSLECQIQEHDIGDFIPLAGPTAEVKMGLTHDASQGYNPKGVAARATNYINAVIDADKANGQWNTVEIYALGDSAVFVVNGTPNMALTKAMFKGMPLTKGKLQLQSEAAEVFYRNIRIRPITELPVALRPLVQP